MTDQTLDAAFARPSNAATAWLGLLIVPAILALLAVPLWNAWPSAPAPSGFRMVRLPPAALPHAGAGTGSTTPQPGTAPFQPLPAVVNQADHDPFPVLPFVLKASAPERERATRCLTAAVYYEAALEPDAGQRAVAQVVINRMRDPNFPKSICGVVFQGWEKTTGCQFSFTCDGSLLRGADSGYWARAKKVAVAFLDGATAQEVGTATHYHADYVDPWWRPAVVRVTQIGAHIFYRWPGLPGTSAAFNGRYAGGELRLSEDVLSGRAARPNALPGVGPQDGTGTIVATVSGGATVLTAPGGRVHATFAADEKPQTPPAQIRQINANLLGQLKAEADKAAPTPEPAKVAGIAGGAAD